MNSNDVHDVLVLLACYNREQAEQIVPTLRARLPFLRTGFEEASGLSLGEFPVFGGLYELYHSMEVEIDITTYKVISYNKRLNKKNY